jgi:hypothetical protein
MYDDAFIVFFFIVFFFFRYVTSFRWSEVQIRGVPLLRAVEALCWEPTTRAAASR